MFSLVFVASSSVSAPTPRPTMSKSDMLRAQTDTLKDSKGVAAMFKIIGGWRKLTAADRGSVCSNLLEDLTSNRAAPLESVDDIIIPRRPNTLQIHGHIVKQDLYIVGGRAAWAISELIETELPEIYEGQEDVSRRAAVDEIARCLKAYKAGVRHAEEKRSDKP